MSKRRIYEIAKQLGMTNKELVSEVREMGYDIKNQMSTLDELDAQIVIEKITKKQGGSVAAPAAPKRTVIRRRRKDIEAAKAEEAAEVAAEAAEVAAEVAEAPTVAPAEPSVAEPDEGAAESPVEASDEGAAEAAEVAAESEAAAPAEPAVEAPAQDAVAASDEGAAKAPDEGAAKAAEGAAAEEAAGEAAEEAAGEAADAAEPEEKKKPVTPKPKRKSPDAAVVIGMRPGFRQVVPTPTRSGPGRYGGRPGSGYGGRPGGGYGGRPGGGYGGRPGGGGYPPRPGRPGGLPSPLPPPGEIPPGGPRGQRRRRGGKDGPPGQDNDRSPRRRSGRRREIRSRNEIYDITEPFQRGKRKKIASRKAKKTEVTTPKDIKRRVRVDGTISVADLAHAMGVKAAEVIRRLMMMGEMVTLNQTVDVETSSVVAEEFGYQVENVAFEEEQVLEVAEPEAEVVEGDPRPPVVTVMGHVDHGKTSILDAIRKTEVVKGESGGITQHIGAYVVHHEKGEIVFVDTPGHAAFTAMRARGAEVTDLVVLVVAADDSIMEQTIEAINHARAANVPILVAVNKMDLPGANLEKVRQNLTEHELVPEDWGGETLVVPVSAKTGEGIDDLLESILLQSELLELKAPADRRASGVVIEAKLDRGRGPAATVLIQEGTLTPGEFLVAGNYYGRVRALVDDTGKNVTAATPAMPVEVLGLSGVPAAGDPINVVANERDARKLVDHRQQKDRQEELAKATPVRRVVFGDEAEGPSEVQLVIKGDVQGSVEALREALLRLSTEEVVVRVILEGVGAISENDVNLAQASNAVVIGFRVRPDAKASRLAEQDQVKVRLYNVIYEAIDEVRQLMAGQLAPEQREKTLGRAEVRQIFTVPKIGAIAGSYVLDGKILRGARARLLRDNKVIHQGRIGSLRRFKDDAREVAAGYECGIGLESFNDIKLSDVIEAYEIEEFAREL